MVTVRIATPSDAGSILEVYKPYVLTTAFTFETEVPSPAEFRSRMETYLRKYPWIVCEINGTVAGYAYASAHREREAYQWTCESSVYIHNHYKGMGIGKELYSVLFKILKMQGLVNVYAGITLPNNDSIALHEKSGFVPFAVYNNVGYKLGAWHKVGWWRLQLNEYEPRPSPPLKFAEMDLLLFEDLLQQAGGNINMKMGY